MPAASAAATVAAARLRGGREGGRAEGRQRPPRRPPPLLSRDKRSSSPPWRHSSQDARTTRLPPCTRPRRLPPSLPLPLPPSSPRASPLIPHPPPPPPAASCVPGTPTFCSLQLLGLRLGGPRRPFKVPSSKHTKSGGNGNSRSNSHRPLPPSLPPTSPTSAPPTVAAAASAASVVAQATPTFRTIAAACSPLPPPIDPLSKEGGHEGRREG